VIKDTLGERVADVRASQRLTASASCLVAGGQGPDRVLERMLAQQNRGGGAKPILEINLAHPLVAAIAKHHNAATCRCCCSSRPRFSTANCRRIRPRSPAG